MRSLPKLFVLAAALSAALSAPAAAVVGPSREPGALAAHVVMILKRSPGAAGFCSGVVVAPDAVLTAAHCVAGITDTRVHYKDASGRPVLIEVAEIIRHPGYRADGQKTRRRTIDLALVRTRAPLSGFSPARTDAGSAVNIGDRFRLAGFGIAREKDAASSGTLRLALIEARAPLSSILLWAKDAADKGAGACTGDSGAPIFSPTDATVVAITAWANGERGAQCGALTQGVLVGPQREWIGAVLAKWAGK